MLALAHRERKSGAQCPVSFLKLASRGSKLYWTKSDKARGNLIPRYVRPFLGLVKLPVRK